MATIKYYVKRSNGDYVYLDQPHAEFSLVGETIQVSGGAGADSVYIGAGTNVDATVLKVGNDKVYFTGNLSDYTQSIDQNTGVYTFTHNTRPTEVVLALTVYILGQAPMWMPRCLKLAMTRSTLPVTALSRNTMSLL